MIWLLWWKSIAFSNVMNYSVFKNLLCSECSKCGSGSPESYKYYNIVFGLNSGPFCPLYLDTTVEISRITLIHSVDNIQQ
jgi:hypothetical protein